MDLSNYSLFGDAGNTSAIPSQMMNTNADGSTDWGMVLSGGIRGAADAAMKALVAEKYASGQLVAPPQVAAQQQTRTLLILAVVAYFVLKS